MPDDSEPHTLIAYLVEPLKMPAQEKRARDVLSEVVEDHLLEAPKHFYKLLALLWILAALAVGLVWNHYRKPAVAVSFTDFGGLLTLPVFDAARHGGETEEELWFLGLGEGTDLEQKEKLILSDPDNPLYYRHYVDAYSAVNDALPPDYFETVERIDPDNAYWYFYAAGELADKACEHLDYVGEAAEPEEVDGIRMYPPSRPKTYEILDAKLLEEAVTLIEQGCALSESHTYLREHIAKVDEIYERLIESATLMQKTAQLIQGFAQTSGLLRLKKVDQVLGASLGQAIESKDEAQCRRLAAMREALLRLHSNQLDEMLVGALVYKAVAHDTALSLMHASRELGLEQDAARYEAQTQQFDAMRNDRRLRQKKGGRDISWHADPGIGILHQYSLPVLGNQVESPPPFDVKDFKPLRLAEHEFMSQWYMMLLGFVLLLLTLPLFFSRFLFSKPIRVSATRAARLLTLSDWLKVSGLGVFLPISLHFLLIRFSPLGARDYGIGALGFAYPMLPLLTLLIAMWMASSLAIRHCLARRLSLQPLTRRQGTAPWAYLALSLGIYILGYLWLSNATGPDRMHISTVRFLTLLWIHVGIFAIFAICGLWIRVRGSHAERFRMLATLSGLIPCVPVVLACLAALLPFHIAGEKHWLSMEDALVPDASKPDYGLYEGKVTQELLREINAIVLPEEK